MRQCCIVLPCHSFVVILTFDPHHSFSVTTAPVKHPYLYSHVYWKCCILHLRCYCLITHQYCHQNDWKWCPHISSPRIILSANSVMRSTCLGLWRRHGRNHHYDHTQPIYTSQWPLLYHQSTLFWDNGEALPFSSWLNSFICSPVNMSSISEPSTSHLVIARTQF